MERNKITPLLENACAPALVIINIKIEETLISERGSEKQKIRFIDTESVVNFINDLTHFMRREKSENLKNVAFTCLFFSFMFLVKKLEENKVKNPVFF